jgi:hypothetical protein
MPDLKLLKFPDDLGRVEACLNTVIESLDCELLGDYNMDLLLTELVNYAGGFDQEEPLVAQFYLYLLHALLIHREMVNVAD